MLRSVTKIKTALLEIYLSISTLMLGSGGYLQLLTALVKGIACAVSETVRPGVNLLEACDYTEVRYLQQEGRVGERLVK
jgi:hypothetical protein